MEHHPELAGTVEVVRLTRLGTAVFVAHPAPRVGT
jgi:hypothetical protein